MKQISNMSDEKFKVMVIDTGLEKRVDEVSENTKEKENIKNNQSQLKYLVAEMKNILEGIHSRLKGAEEQISDLEGRAMGRKLSRKQKENRLIKK